jgi:hypothetical protein
MELICDLKMSVTNYQPTPLDTQEERRPTYTAVEDRNLSLCCYLKLERMKAQEI